MVYVLWRQIWNYHDIKRQNLYSGSLPADNKGSGLIILVPIVKYFPSYSRLISDQNQCNKAIMWNWYQINPYAETIFGLSGQNSDVAR